MSETMKSILFCAIAGVCLLVTIFTLPKTNFSNPDGQVNQLLIEKLTDPKIITKLKIESYKQDTVKFSSILLSRVGGRWFVDSVHENNAEARKIGYPVDAEKKIADSVTRLIGVKILSVASNSLPKAGDHERFGVEELKLEELEYGSVGIGTLVTFTGEGDQELCKLIIGHQVSQKPDNYYVRLLSGEEPNRVYVVKLDHREGQDSSSRILEVFQSNFRDWIDTNLLDLGETDISKITVKDHSHRPEIDQFGRLIAYDSKLRSILTFTTKKDDRSQWEIESLQNFDDKEKLLPAPLKPDEELNSLKLSELKSALSDLSIVDVESKPSELRDLLRQGSSLDEGIKENETLSSLGQRGFYFIPRKPLAAKGYELQSSDGEIIVSTTSGVEYVLRFGDVKGLDTTKDKKDKTEEKSSGLKKTRYLFIETRFNRDLIAPPELKKLPQKPVFNLPKKKTTEPPVTKENQPKAPEPGSAGSSLLQPNPANLTPAQIEALKKKFLNQVNQKQPTEEELKKIKEQMEEKYQIDLQEAKDANQKAIDQYNKEVEKGQQKVRLLNDRFANWYYVISDDLYHKIHLTRKDVIQKKEKPKTPDTKLPIQPNKTDPKEFTLPRLDPK